MSNVTGASKLSYYFTGNAHPCSSQKYHTNFFALCAISRVGLTESGRTRNVSVTIHKPKVFLEELFCRQLNVTRAY